MVQKYKKMALTVKQELEFIEKVENEKSATKLAKIMGQILSDCIHEMMLPG
jgi:hypothetical protein